MKTSIILLVALLCVTTSNAQKVPSHIEVIFSETYPNANHVKWDHEGDKYEATFKNEGQKTSILYSANGMVEETETTIFVSELSQKVLDYVKTKGKVKEAARIVTAQGEITYEAEVNKTDFLFDDQGDFLKSDTDKED